MQDRAVNRNPVQLIEPVGSRSVDGANRPLMTVLPGEDVAAVAREQAEWLSAWAAIAEGCETGLRELHPEHPRRRELQRLLADARECAGLPRVPQLRSA